MEVASVTEILERINASVTGKGLPIMLFTVGSVMLVLLCRYLFDPRFIKKNLFARNSSESSLSSLCLALAGTLGVGNITGTAAAIAAGGVGAVFWMWVCAAVSSVLKYSETLLAVRYRVPRPDGGVRGGAFQYVKNGLGSPFFAALFAVVCILTSVTMGNMTQVRAAADGVKFIPSKLLGVIFFITVLAITAGGGKRISAFSVKVVPPLCLFYALCSITVIAANAEKIGEVTKTIISEAFTPLSGVSGVMGYLCSPALRLGITRGIMSSEAGCGSAPMAHARAENAEPVRQGLFGITEVICDTLVLCTLTAYTILLSGVPLTGEATDIALDAFSSVLGGSARVLLGISIFFFALAAVSCWSFYAQESLLNLGAGKRVMTAYGVIFAFFSFAGCVVSEALVWELSDIFVSVMAIVNMTALVLLSPEIMRVTKEAAEKDQPISFFMRSSAPFSRRDT